MSTDKFEQQSTSDVDVATVAVDLSSLRSALQHYEGNGIPNIIAQFLHAYQPKDGIVAYEHVLRKVQDLLKDCDSRKKQMLLSTIPAPKNAPGHTINEAFRTITGFSKFNLQKNNTFQDTLDVKNTDGITNNGILSSEKNFSRDKNGSSSKSSLSEGFPFRGFAESEISTTTHARNTADPSSSNQSDNNPKNWLDRYNKCQMSNYRQYLLNKRYYAPVRGNDTNDSQLCYSSQMSTYQNTHPVKTRDNGEMITDSRRDKVLRRFNDARYGSQKFADTNVFDKDIKTDVLQAAFGQGATVARTIKESVRSMDVCWDEDQNFLIDADDLLAIARDGLKASLNRFLRRAREGVFIELSTFPRVRPYPRADSSNSVRSASKDRKPTSALKVLEEDPTRGLSNDEGKSCLLLKQQIADANLEGNRQASDEKTKQTAFACVAGSKRISREHDKAIELPLLKNDDDLDHDTEKKVTTIKCKEDDTKESIFGHKAVEQRTNDENSEGHIQARSISELAAYKKQYYDTLLSVQRAKVAVTNSLASSSDHLAVYDDPYYTNYGYYQRQHLFQQRHQFAARSQFSTCPTALPGLTSAHDTQYSWARSDCKYLLLKQLRLRQQASPMYARDRGGWIHHRYVRPAYPCALAPDLNGGTKQCVRRKSLEDIVGKLKGSECSSVNN